MALNSIQLYKFFFITNIFDKSNYYFTKINFLFRKFNLLLYISAFLELICKYYSELSRKNEVKVK